MKLKTMIPFTGLFALSLTHAWCASPTATPIEEKTSEESTMAAYEHCVKAGHDYHLLMASPTSFCVMGKTNTRSAASVLAENLQSILKPHLSIHDQPFSMDKDGTVSFRLATYPEGQDPLAASAALNLQEGQLFDEGMRPTKIKISRDLATVSAWLKPKSDAEALIGIIKDSMGPRYWWRRTEFGTTKEGNRTFTLKTWFVDQTDTAALEKSKDKGRHNVARVHHALAETRREEGPDSPISILLLDSTPSRSQVRFEALNRKLANRFFSKVKQAFPEAQCSMPPMKMDRQGQVTGNIKLDYGSKVAVN